MSARVTDERLVELTSIAADDPKEALRCVVEFGRAILDLRDERTAHRATEAKLRAALAEGERLKKSRDSYKDDCARWKREAESNGRMEIEERALKEAAESALSATKAEKSELENLLAKEASDALTAAKDAQATLAATKAKLEAAEAEIAANRRDIENAAVLIKALRKARDILITGGQAAERRGAEQMVQRIDVLASGYESDTVASFMEQVRALTTQGDTDGRT